MNTRETIVRQSVILWFERAVLGLNLCPFAHKPYRDQRIHFVVSRARNEEHCLADLFINLDILDQQPAIETILLITPDMLGCYADYLQFLDLADAFLQREGWSGIYQIASFHPDYQFAGTRPSDRENWTNRSPFPILHLLREDSVSRAIASHRGIESIPGDNIERIGSLDSQAMRGVFGPRFSEEKH